MIWHRRIFFIYAIGLVIGFVTAKPAMAQTRVGEAVLVKNQVVRGFSGGATSPINVGDGLLRDEIVRTGLDSATRLVMADNTNLSLGPSATIKLDRTVFNDEHSYREIAVRMVSGAFRFVTGDSAKAAYTITTGLVTIGVRGTTLDVLSQQGKTTVVLQEGAARVCTIAGQCTELTQPGDTVVVTSAGGKVTTQKTGHPSWTFAANCAAAGGLCAVTQYADASDPGGTLCGR